MFTELFKQQGHFRLASNSRWTLFGRIVSTLRKTREKRCHRTGRLCVECFRERETLSSCHLDGMQHLNITRLFLEEGQTREQFTFSFQCPPKPATRVNNGHTTQTLELAKSTTNRIAVDWVEAQVVARSLLSNTLNLALNDRHLFERARALGRS